MRHLALRARTPPVTPLPSTGSSREREPPNCGPTLIQGLLSSCTRSFGLARCCNTPGQSRHVPSLTPRFETLTSSPIAARTVSRAAVPPLDWVGRHHAGFEDVGRNAEARIRVWVEIRGVCTRFSRRHCIYSSSSLSPVCCLHMPDRHARLVATMRRERDQEIDSRDPPFFSVSRPLLSVLS